MGFSELIDIFNLGHLSAARHGNGRDWWILANKFKSNTVRRYLLSDRGIENMGEQSIGDLIPNGVGYSAFSSSGEWYASYNVYGYTSDPHAVIQYYRFNRTGLLIEPHSRYFPTPDTEGYGGVAFSPSSRFMYVSRLRTIYQYDLEAPDITASEQVVAVTDSFKTATGKLTRFYGLQLAPDGRIYGNVYCSNTQYLHVIDQPDLPGPACNVLQHAIFLPAQNFGTLPNLPYSLVGVERQPLRYPTRSASTRRQCCHPTFRSGPCRPPTISVFPPTAPGPIRLIWCCTTCRDVWRGAGWVCA